MDRRENGTAVDQKQNETVAVVLKEITLKLSLTFCPVQIFMLIHRKNELIINKTKSLKAYQKKKEHHWP